MKEIAFLILLVYLNLSLKAQQSNVRFHQISLEEGLSHSLVSRMLEDDLGFLWFGTQDGLNRYDGYEFKIYYADKTNKTPSKNWISDIYKDRSGQIWIFYRDKGLDRFDPFSETFFSYTNRSGDSTSISSNSSFAGVMSSNKFIEDNDNTLWIATDKGINRYVRETDSFEPFEFDPLDETSISDNRVICFAEDSTGYLWIGTQNGLNRFDKRTKTFKRFLSNRVQQENSSVSVFNTIYVDNENRVWAGTIHEGCFVLQPDGNGEYTYQSYINEPFNPNFEPSVYAIQRLSSGEVVMGTEQGLYRIKQNGKELQPELVSFTKNFAIRSIVEDQNGNLWVNGQVDNSSVVMQIKSDFSTGYRFEYDPNDPYSYRNERLTFLYKSKNDLLWIGTEKGGVYRVDLFAKNFKYINSNPKNDLHLVGNEVYSIYQDEHENLWIGTTDALNLLNFKSRTSKSFNNQKNLKSGISWEYSNNIASRLVGTICETRDHKMWLGSFDYKVTMYDPQTNRFLNFHNNPNDSTAFRMWSLRNIFQTSTGDLYFGGTSHGLCRLNLDGKSFSYFPVDTTNHCGTNDEWINKIYEDRDGNLWLGTLNGGLNCYHPKTGKFSYYRHSFADKTSISNDDVRTILQPKNGDGNTLWVGTSGGLNRFDIKAGTFKAFTIENGLPNNMIHGILEDNDGNLWLSGNKGLIKFNPVDETFQHFTHEDGLLSNEFNEGAYYKANDGILYFGGVRGVNYFNPSEIVDYPIEGNVILTSLKVNQVTVFANDTIDNHVIIDRSISYASQINLNYKDKILSFEFASLQMAAPKKIKYRFRLLGFEEEWNEVDSKQRFANYTNLNSGEYTLQLMCTSSDGKWSDKIKEVKVIKHPPFWERTWFKLAIIALVMLLFGLILKIRTNLLQRQRDLLSKLVQEQTNDLKLANVNLERQKNEIVDISNKLHESDQAKLRFFTNISHEFRTPLTLIMSPVERLVQQNEYHNSEDVKNNLNIVYRNSKRLFRLINQLLEIRRIETGNMKLLLNNDDIIGFLFHVFEMFSSYAISKDINLDFSSSKDYLKVWFDNDKVEKICFNLLANAIHYTPVGGRVTLAVKETIGTDGTQMVQIDVTDTGRGIPESQMANLFDRFNHIASHKDSGKISTGIGLSLTNDLVKAHRGEILVHSIEEKGTTFSILLPANEKSYQPDELRSNSEKVLEYAFEFSKSMLTASEYLQENGINETGDDGKMKVLIVEDDKDLQQFLTTELKSNYKILLASNGADGLEQVKTFLPDLVICDIMMPVMDGLTLCRTIKEDVLTSHIPVFLLTAKSEQENIIEGLETGADDYIMKPFSVEALKLKIKNQMKSRKLLAKQFSSDLNPIPEGVKINTIDKNLLERFVKFVEDNIDQSDLSGDDVAAELGLSKSNLYKKLKALTGMSVNIYIRTIRLKVAARLLRSGKYNISEVAYAVGFNNPKYFSTCFRELFDKAPTEYMSE